MKNIAGTPVEGANFFGREKDAARLVDILDNDDILLLGPRRIGKTSIGRAVMALVRADNWRAIEINAASCSDECGFLDKLEAALTPELASIGSQITSAIGSALSHATGRIKSLKVPIPGAGALGVELGDSAAEEWTEVGSEVLRLIGKAEQRWLIYVDELPIMLFNIIRNDPVAGVQRVRRFLDWFRNDVRALPGAHAVRWLISGSVGLDTLVQQHGMADTINSFSHQSLAPFSVDVAIDMLAALARHYSIALAADDARSIVDAIQWPQPYYLQVAFNHLRDLLNAHPGAGPGTLTQATPAASPTSLIEQAIDKMVQPGGDNDFHHWEERLGQQLDRNHAAHARALLALAAVDTGARADALLDALRARMPNASQEESFSTYINLRDILERDGYWWPDLGSGTKRYRFRLEPLRRWWNRRNTL